MKEKANLEANRAYINSKSDKVLYDRFCSDFDKACHSLRINSTDDSASLDC